VKLHSDLSSAPAPAARRGRLYQQSVVYRTDGTVCVA
jgi:hypothetical protein